LILNAELVASAADGRHRAGMWQAKILPMLQLPKQKPGFDSS
jgi:hypothetical protein